MNERIRLDFVDFEPSKASWMLGCARTFASSKIDGKPGQRAGTVHTIGPEGRPRWRCLTYWTPARMVVVREVEL